MSRKKYEGDLNDSCPFKLRKHGSYCLVGDCFYYDEVCPIYAKFLRIIKKSSKEPRTIYNPVTKTYYEIKSISTKYGKKGQIVGMWESNAEDRTRADIRKEKESLMKIIKNRKDKKH